MALVAGWDEQQSGIQSEGLRRRPGDALKKSQVAPRATARRPLMGQSTRAAGALTMWEAR